MSVRMSAAPLLLLVMSGMMPAWADDAATVAAAAACDRMQACAMEQVQTMPPEYRAMMEANLNHLCDALPWAQYQTATGVSGTLRKPFIACMDSIANASCADLDADEGSPACQELQQRADAFHGTVDE